MNLTLKRLIAPVAALTVLAAAATTVVAAEKLAKKPYENLSHGFYVYTPEGWVSVPPQPGEKVRIVKFQSDAASKGSGYVKSEFEVLYLKRKTVEETQKHAGGTKSSKYERIESDFPDWIKRRYLNAKCKKAKFMRTPKRLKGALQFQTTFGGGRSTVKGMALVIPFADNSADIVLHYFCTDKEMRKLKMKVFIPSLGSFKWSQKLKDKGVKADQKLMDSADGEDSPVAKRALDEKRKVKDKPGWDVARSKHYVFVFNARPEIVMAVRNQIEQILPAYLRLFPPSDPDIVKKIAPIVRITKDLDIYHAYGGPPGSAGYWSSGHEELVFYDDGTSKALKTLAVLRHEAFHQYIFYSSGSVSPHSWFNEGYGDYFAGCEVTGKGTLIEKPFTWRMSTIANAVREEKHVPLKEITSYSQGQYYARSGLCYAEGWSIIYFLNKGPNSSVRRKFKPEWKTILKTYFETLKKEWGDPTVGEDDVEGGDEGGDEGGGKAPPGAPPGDPDAKPDPTPDPKPGGGDTPGPRPAPGSPDTKPGDGPAPDAKPGDAPKARKRPRRPRSYMQRFTDARKKAVAAAFKDWEDEDWDEFEKVWSEFVKKNFK